jgi:hypothetical protein
MFVIGRPDRTQQKVHRGDLSAASKEVLRQRTADYQNWVEAYARNHRIPIEWAEKGVRKEDHVLPWQRRMVRTDSYGVYGILKSMEQGPAAAPFMAEARQTFDPVFLIELVPGPDGVAVEQQHFGDRLTAHAFVQQHQRVGAASQAVRGRTVAGQLNQVAARFAVQEARADHG